MLYIAMIYRIFNFLVLLFLVQGSVFSLEKKINGINYVPQTWNNCAPASISMVFSKWKLSVSQGTIEKLVKTDSKDFHVSVDQIKGVSSYYNFNTTVIRDSQINDIKAFLNSNIPVIVPIWHIREPGDEMGHYIVINGYNDDKNIFYIQDSLLPGEKEISIKEFDQIWRVFSRTLISIYPDNTILPVLEHSTVLSITRAKDGVEFIDTDMLYTKESDNDFFSWYNLGNIYFNNKMYAESAEAYTTSLEYGYPFRFFWYNSTIFESYYINGMFQKILTLSNTLLGVVSNLEEIWYWRAKAQLGLGHNKDAVTSLNNALKYRSTYPEVIELLEKI